MRYSDALVAACARAGAWYVDINGEIPWVARVIRRDDARARVGRDDRAELRVRLGAVRPRRAARLALLAPRLARGEQARAVSATHMSGALSGGTIHTGLVMEELFPDEMREPFLLGGEPAELLRGARRRRRRRRRGGAPRAPRTTDETEAAYDPARRALTAPFTMAKINTRVVRRSAGALGAYGGALAGGLYRERALAPGGA